MHAHNLIYIPSHQNKNKEKYIHYEDLKSRLEEMKKGQLIGHANFYVLLDKSFSVCRNFADDWFAKIENSGLEKNDIFREGLELHQFVTINQEALRKIIKKHDKNMPGQRLYPAWRYCMQFSVPETVVKIICIILHMFQ